MLKVDAKQLFADSIVELSKTKPLEKITIGEITDNCKAGRQTFYNHFKDKEDLIEYIYLCDREKGRKALNGEYSLKVHMKKMLDICAEKRMFYVYAYDMLGQNSLSEVVLKKAIDYYREMIVRKTSEKTPDHETEMAIRFYSYGSLCMVRDWIKKNIRCSSEELAEILVENAPEKIKKYLQ